MTGGDPWQLQGGQPLRAVEGAQLLSPWQQASSALLLEAASEVTSRTALCLCSDLYGFTACNSGLANGCDPAQILADGYVIISRITYNDNDTSPTDFSDADQYGNNIITKTGIVVMSVLLCLGFSLNPKPCFVCASGSFLS